MMCPERKGLDQKEGSCKMERQIRKEICRCIMMKYAYNRRSEVPVGIDEEIRRKVDSS